MNWLGQLWAWWCDLWRCDIYDWIEVDSHRWENKTETRQRLSS